MSKIIEKAMNYAFDKHGDHKRKGSDVPYFVHLMDVASALMKNGMSENLIAAGFLHDIVEDRDSTRVTEEMLRQEFNDEIVDFVMGVTESNNGDESSEEKRESWRRRKEDAIAHVRNVSRDIKMLKCADKLSNIRDMKFDYKTTGDEIWGRFNSPNGKEDQKWYFGGVINNLLEIKDTRVYKELLWEFNELFGKLEEKE